MRWCFGSIEGHLADGLGIDGDGQERLRGTRRVLIDRRPLGKGGPARRSALASFLRQPAPSARFGGG
jgi:hypothetical protein